MDNNINNDKEDLFEEDLKEKQSKKESADNLSFPKNEKRSILALISFILGLAYILFLLSYFSSAQNLAEGFAAALVTPHMVAVGVAVIFNGLGFFLRNRNFMLVAGILYTIAIVLFPMYFIFVIIQAVLSFIAFARMGKKTYTEEGDSNMGEIKKPFYKKWWFWLIIVIIIIGALGSDNDSKDVDDSKDSSTVVSEDDKIDDEPVEEEKVEKDEEGEKVLSLGDSFEFDNFKVDIGEEYSFDVIKNQFSEHDGKDVIVLPVTITNISGETQLFNMFYFTIFDQSGNTSDSVSAYFDNSIDFVGEMRDGAEKETNFYILYSEDGDYYIEFKKPGGERIEVKIPVEKE